MDMLSGKEFYRLSIPRKISVNSLNVLLNAWRDIQVSTYHSNVIVLEGSSGYFCDGFSVSEFLEKSKESEILLSDAISQFSRFIIELYQSDFITVAVVNGAARGGGLGLASACDFVISHKDAVFQLPEAMFGLLPGIILPFLENRTNLQFIKKMYISCESISAKNALAAGLIDIIYSGDEPETEIISLIKNQIKIRCRRTDLVEFKKFLALNYIRLEEKVEHGARILKKKATSRAIKKRIENFIFGNLLQDKV